MDIASGFGLRHHPFGPTTELDAIYPSPSFIRTRDSILARLLDGSRLVALIGPAGSGKTLLLRALERTLATTRSVARIGHGDLARLDATPDTAVLLVDEADGIDDATFQSIVARSRLAGGPAVVLACTGRCLERLPRVDDLVRVDLAPLSPVESRAFLVDRLTRAGRPDLFSDEALGVIVAAARGLPQMLRVLAAGALYHAASEGAERVEESHAVQAAAASSFGRAAAPRTEAAAAPLAVAANDPEPDKRRSWWGAAPPLVRFGILIGLLLLSLPVLGYVINVLKDSPRETESTEVAAALDEELPASVPVATPEPAPAELPPQAPPVETADGPPLDLGALPEEPPVEGVAAIPEDPPAPVPAASVTQGAGTAEPQAPPAPRTESEPENAVQQGARVFVHYDNAANGADEAAADIAADLARQGYAVIDVRGVPSRIEQASVRYFFDADRSAARRLVEQVEDELREQGLPSQSKLKEMTGYRPAPRRGTIEVWVPNPD